MPGKEATYARSMGNGRALDRLDLNAALSPCFSEFKSATA